MVICAAEIGSAAENVQCIPAVAPVTVAVSDVAAVIVSAAFGIEEDAGQFVPFTKQIAVPLIVDPANKLIGDVIPRPGTHGVQGPPDVA